MPIQLKLSLGTRGAFRTETSPRGRTLGRGYMQLEVLLPSGKIRSFYGADFAISSVGEEFNQLQEGSTWTFNCWCHRCANGRAWGQLAGKVEVRVVARDGWEALGEVVGTRHHQPGYLPHERVKDPLMADLP